MNGRVRRLGSADSLCFNDFYTYLQNCVFTILFLSLPHALLLLVLIRTIGLPWTDSAFLVPAVYGLAAYQGL